MARKKNIETTPEVIAESPTVAVNDSKEVSAEYTAFEAFIEKYKALNPEKYEAKKEELLKKLNTLK